MTAVLLAVLTLLALAVGWIMALLGLPGSWVIAATAALHAWLAPEATTPQIAWTTVGILVGLALLGELLEAGASAAGVSRVGASRRAKVYAVLGSLVGSVVGALIGLPVPIVGSLLAAVVFGAVGAAVGSGWAEWNRGEQVTHSLRVGNAAFWGRVLGTVAKATVTTVMVVIVVVDLLLRQ
ncbi:MAG: DUF456 family protein [Planctomycetota bacterium]